MFSCLQGFSYGLGQDQPHFYNYVLAPQAMKPGDMIRSGPGSPVKPGNTFQLKDIPTSIKIHNIELFPGRGGQLCRAAGTFATMLAKEQEGYAILRLPSGTGQFIHPRKQGCINPD